MRLTVLEFREMVRASLLQERRPEMLKREIYAAVIFDPKSNSFSDRWGRPLPRGPESMDVRTVAEWLASNGVESIEVKGRKTSPKGFAKYLDMLASTKKPMQKPPEQELGYAIEPTQPDTFHGSPTIVRGMPVIKGRKI